ncbi:MAG: cytochrome C [Proteobacteria bacterium]|nr:cytochrome C [Pseudomonadota bacterium]
MSRALHRSLVLLAAMSGVALWASNGAAVPSFARQTGMACNVCHTTFPQLTKFGRRFKAIGYTLSEEKQIKASKGKASSPLELNEIVPLSFMAQASLTTTHEHQPGTQNNDAQFPQQLSLLLAGSIADYVGSFLQVTYTPEDDHFGMDNADIRYARTTTAAESDLVYGLTLNNNPTVEDLWNSTPAWGFPWTSSETAPTPAAAALIDGALAQDVTGLGAYALWNDHLYVAGAVYRSEHVGGAQPPDDSSENTLDGVAPYWRLAWQQSWGPNYLAVGTYGLYARLYPEGVSGDTDDYTDIAFDFQYERTIGGDLLAVRSTYIHEDQDLNATFAAGGSANRSNGLDTFRINGTYNRSSWGMLSLGYFLTRGDADEGLYAPAPADGSASGSPDSEGLIAEIGLFPWQNLRLSLLYTAYFQFNGAANNYDGDGRDAADNNTIYWLGWFMW